VEIAETAARAFTEIGRDGRRGNPDLGDPSSILKKLYGGAQAGAHAARSAEQKAQMDPDLVAYAEASAGLSVVEYVRAVSARQAMVDALRRFFERYDLLLTPTLCLPAFPLGVVGPSEVAGRKVTHLGWTLCYPFNYSGQPAVSVPAGWTASGLPLACRSSAGRLEDALVLRAAATFEALRPWADRRPRMNRRVTQPDAGALRPSVETRSATGSAARKLWRQVRRDELRGDRLDRLRGRSELRFGPLGLGPDA
jgi:aspartyl-tRNA(Asn)/glutamyl-tRNA(Gln) amidotransferase subunit A